MQVPEDRLSLSSMAGGDRTCWLSLCRAANPAGGCKSQLLFEEGEKEEKKKKAKRDGMCIFKGGFCARWGLPAPSHPPLSLPPHSFYLGEKNQFSSNLLLPP